MILLNASGTKEFLGKAWIRMASRSKMELARLHTDSISDTLYYNKIIFKYKKHWQNQVYL